MKKIILFIVVMISCQYSFGQRINVHKAFEIASWYAKLNRIQMDGGWRPYGWNDSEDTKDKAFATPNSALVKRWYFADYSDLCFKSGYIDIKANGTFLLNYQTKYSRIHGEVPGKWSRSGLNLKFTFNFGLAKAVSYIEELEGLSERQKYDVNQTRQALQTKWRRLGSGGVFTQSRSISILDDKHMMFDGHYSDSYMLKNNFLLCTWLISEKYVMELQKEREVSLERKMEAEDGKSLVQAWDNAVRTDGYFDEAISIVDKVIAKRPDFALAYWYKAKLLCAKGNFAGIKPMYDKAISIEPDRQEDEEDDLNIVMERKLYTPGWKMADMNFPKIIPFKKIRVKKELEHSESYSIYFWLRPEPGRRISSYFVDYSRSAISGEFDADWRDFKDCTDVGDGWIEYEFRMPMYFLRFDGQAEDCLQVLIE